VRRAVDTAEVVLDRARADPQDVLDAVRNIRAECGAATTALYRDGSVSLRKALADAVLSYSKARPCAIGHGCWLWALIRRNREFRRSTVRRQIIWDI